MSWTLAASGAASGGPALVLGSFRGQTGRYAGYELIEFGAPIVGAPASSAHTYQLAAGTYQVLVNLQTSALNASFLMTVQGATSNTRYSLQYKSKPHGAFQSFVVVEEPSEVFFQLRCLDDEGKLFDTSVQMSRVA